MSNQYHNQADDLVYAMRQLAGTGNVDKASEIMRDMLDLLNEATRLDRECGTDESNMTLTYVIEMSELCADNIKGLPKGNRSRTARGA